MKQKEYIMNATTNYYGMFTDAGNAAVNDVFEAVKKIFNTSYDYKDTLDGTGIFYNVALPMLEKLEVMPEFEEAGDTAVREAMYQKLEDAGIIPLY